MKASWLQPFSGSSESIAIIASSSKENIRLGTSFCLNSLRNRCFLVRARLRRMCFQTKGRQTPSGAVFLLRTLAVLTTIRSRGKLWSRRTRIRSSEQEVEPCCATADKRRCDRRRKSGGRCCRGTCSATVYGRCSGACVCCGPLVN